MTDAAQTAHAMLSSADRAAWTLAAVATALGAGPSEALDAAAAVASAAGIPLPDEPADRRRLAAVATAPLLQATRFLQGGGTWTEQDDEALVAQGDMSARNARGIADGLFPQMEGLAAAITRPGARFLDVGVGVASMAVAMCRVFPTLSVVGLDVFPRALELARRNVAVAGLDDRIDLRELDVADLGDDSAYDLAWLPAPFIPQPSLERALPRLAAALRPGGWLLVAHGRFDGDPVDVAITRLKTVAYGGTPMSDEEAEAALRDLGLVDVRTLATPTVAPAMSAGRAPVRA